MLAVDVCKRRLRRIDSLDELPSHDVTHLMLGACVQETSQSSFKLWLRTCLLRCHQCISADPSLRARLVELAAFMDISDWKEASDPLAERQMAEAAESGALADTGLPCPACAKVSSHQMALRRHVRAMHSEIIPSKMVFDVRKDSLGGLPTCRHCKMEFRKWQGLRKHIENQVCNALSRDTSTQIVPYRDDDIPLVQTQELLDLIETQGTVAVAEYDGWCDRLRQYCCICNQWFSMSQAMGYHQSIHHKKALTSGRQWARDHVRSKVFVISNPCRWCHQSFAQSTNHKCPVLIQLGILHTVLLGDGRADTTAADANAISPRNLGRTGLADVWGVATQQRKASSITREPRSRSEEGATKPISAPQTRTRWGALFTQSMHRHGPAIGEARRLSQQDQVRHHIPHVLGHVCSNATSDVGHITQVEVGARGRHSITGLSSENNLACQRVHQDCKNPHTLDRPAGRSRDQGIQEARHLRCTVKVRQEDMECTAEESRIRGTSDDHCRSTCDNKASGSVVHGSRSCDEVSFNKTIGSRVCGFHPGLSSGDFPVSSLLRSVLSRFESVMRDQHPRAHELSDEAVDATAFGFGGRYAEAIGSVGQRQEVADIHVHDHDRDLANSDVTPLGALHDWFQNGERCILAPKLRNPDVLCYMNSVISCLLICRSKAMAVSYGWGLIDEMFCFAGSEPINLLTELECLQPVLETWGEVHQQHDALEFVEHLRPYVPILCSIQAESRLALLEGIDRQPERLRLVAPSASSSSCSLQDLVNAWHVSEAGLKAVLGRPPLLVVSIPRFDYEAGSLRRIGGRISCEPGTVRVPYFPSMGDLETSWLEYNIVACILHNGRGLDSGHYRYLALGSGGYFLGDDFKDSEYFAFPPSDLMSQIYLVFMMRFDDEVEVIQ